MKKILLIALVSCSFSGQAYAQLGAQGKKYLWTDSIRTTVTAIDSQFTYVWDQVVIKTDSIDIWCKFGAEADTSNWSSRDWFILESGESISIGPGTRLQRFQWKSNAGVGYIFFFGYKRKKQGS